MFRLLSVWLALLALANSIAVAAMPIEPARVKSIAAFLPEKPTGFGLPAPDRAFWNALSQQSGFVSAVTNAERLAKKATPAMTDDLFLDYSRTGNRDRGQAVIFERRKRLTIFVLAECIEHKGRFLHPLEDEIAAICTERTWVYPAHDGGLNNFYGRTIDVDLRAADVAWNLATADYLLGTELSPATRDLIRTNIEHRVLQPFRDMVDGRRKEIWWMRAEMNWNAVCLAGVTGAALALEPSRETRAWHIAAAQDYIRYFLKGFPPDGYCSEGVGYWNYGFGNFLMLGEAVRLATGNHVDLLDDPVALAPAHFAANSEIINGVFTTIADCRPGTQPDPRLLRYIAMRLDSNPAPARGTVANTESLYAALAFAEAGSAPKIALKGKSAPSPLRSWFPDGGVLICRSQPDAPVGFGVALKGGNNGENHNHNDVGSFSVVRGQTMLVCDPGGEVYTKRTFGPHRYDSQVLNSFGHAVPVIAGQLQRTGAEAHAVIKKTGFTDTTDTLVLDVTSAYAVPELQHLERTFTFHRTEKPSLDVGDSVAFSKPKTFETALITWSDWKQISPNEIRIGDTNGAVDVSIETGGLPVAISATEIHEDVHTPRLPVHIGIALKDPVRRATVTLQIRSE